MFSQTLDVTNRLDTATNSTARVSVLIIEIVTTRFR